MPRVDCPIGPLVAPEIPKDILKSEDAWHLELYIVDPFNGEACIFRSPNVSFAESREASDETGEKIRHIPRRQRQQTDRHKLICHAEDSVCRYLLYATPTLTFGRGEDNDLVFQLFPVNPENNRATGRISRQHGELKYQNGVWKLTDASTGGTWINDEYIGRNQQRILQDGDQISIARELTLQFNCDANHACIRRLNNLAGIETYLFLIATVTIGSDPSNGIVLSDAGVSDFHATIFHRDDEFWIRDLGSETGTFINSERLRSNEICPLAKGLVHLGRSLLPVGCYA